MIATFHINIWWPWHHVLNSGFYLDQLNPMIFRAFFDRKLCLNQTFSSQDEDKEEENSTLEHSRMLSKILVRNKFLTQLSMRFLPHVTDATLHCLPRTLTHLDIGGCLQVTDAGVRRMASNCPQLCSVSLSRTLITDRSLSYLSCSKCRTTLREIRVNGCVNITDAGIEVSIRE